MKIKVNFVSFRESSIVLPKHHIGLLQGLVYNLLDPFLRSSIHEKGYRFGKRQFRLFCFSKLVGNFKLTKDVFVFSSKVSLFISSPINEILESMAVNLLKGKKFSLGRNSLGVDSIEVIPQPDFSSGRVVGRAVSPITVYSSFRDPLGRQKTYYYSPFEKRFFDLIVENLRKKYVLVYGREEGFDFDISPRRITRLDKRVLIYEKKKGDASYRTVIHGWLGTYLLKGTPKTLRLAYDCGLGAKNSQGFGMWECLGIPEDVRGRRRSYE